MLCFECFTLMNTVMYCIDNERAFSKSAACCLFLTSFRKESFFEMLPQNTKQDTLQAIGENLGFEASEKEAVVARFFHDHFDNLRVRQLFRMTLFVDLDDANRVGTGIGNSRGGESQNGAAAQFGQLRILFGNLFRQEIVREKPRIVTDKGGTGGRQGAIVQRHGSVELDLVHNGRELARHLHGSFDRINRHNHNAKHGGGGTGRHGFEPNVHVLGGFERIQGRQNTRIGSRVSKATERACTLHIL
jgi:hypothetical protein